MFNPSYEQLASRQTIEQHVFLEAASSAQFSICVTRRPNEIIEAQQLRYRVFGIEGGALLQGPTVGIDADDYDSACDHLIARDLGNGRVVGTYRIISPQLASELGYYSDLEFDTKRLDALKPSMCEFGRACVDAAYRGGAVIMQLWAGLAAYMVRRGHQHVLGVASVNLLDGGHRAASLYRQFQETCMADEALRVEPRRPLCLTGLNQRLEVEPPALIKGYLRVGARVCGAPSFDPAFNSADFLMVLSLAQMNRRYARHFGLLERTHSVTQ